MKQKTRAEIAARCSNLMRIHSTVEYLVIQESHSNVVMNSYLYSLERRYRNLLNILSK